jgi:hypothetical protein
LDAIARGLLKTVEVFAVSRAVIYQSGSAVKGIL